MSKIARSCPDHFRANPRPQSTPRSLSPTSLYHSHFFVDAVPCCIITGRFLTMRLAQVLQPSPAVITENTVFCTPPDVQCGHLVMSASKSVSQQHSCSYVVSTQLRFAMLTGDVARPRSTFGVNRRFTFLVTTIAPPHSLEHLPNATADAPVRTSTSNCQNHLSGLQSCHDVRSKQTFFHRRRSPPAYRHQSSLPLWLCPPSCVSTQRNHLHDAPSYFCHHRVASSPSTTHLHSNPQEDVAPSLPWLSSKFMPTRRCCGLATSAAIVFPRTDWDGLQVLTGTCCGGAH